MGHAIEAGRSTVESVRNAQRALEEAMKLDVEAARSGRITVRIEACEAAVLAIEGADADGDEAAMGRAIGQATDAAYFALLSASTLIRSVCDA